MEWYIVLSILIISLTLLLLLGLPVAFSLGFLSIICSFIFWPGMTGAYGVALAGYGHMNNFTLVCIPLFILMAELVMYTKMGTETYDAADKFFHNLPGGIGMASTVFGAVFAAICGASTAGTATVGLVSLPEMIKRNYDQGLAGAIVAFSGALSILIPPSIILILYGTLAQQSIGALFAGGMMPGILMTVLALLYIFFRVSIHPEVAPRDEVTYSWSEKIRSLGKVWSLLLVVVLLLGTIYSGVATPTEASAVSALAVFIIALVRKRMSFSILRKALLHTVRTTAMIGWIIIGATSFGYVIIFSGCAAQLTSWIISLALPKWAIVAILMLGYLIMGMFLDPAAIVMMTTPLILPLLKALNINLLWFGVLMTINMCAGNISPPMGLNIYIVKGLKEDLDLKRLFLAAVPFMIIDIITIVLCMVFPEIITAFPKILGY